MEILNIVGLWKWVFRHRHRWETTHTNRWMVATRQKCACGVTRSFEFYPDREERRGMPWEKGRWVWSDGTETAHTGGFDG